VTRTVRLATQRNGWWWCVGAAVLFGAATPATKRLVGDIGSISLAGLLYLGAALAVAPFVHRSEPRAPAAPAARQRFRLMVAVGLGGGLAPVLLVLALQRTPASQVSLLLNLELVATTVISRVFLREHVGARAGAGIVLVLLGGIVLSGVSAGGIATGAILVASTCICWGVDNAITASLDAYSPTQITFAKGIIAGSVNLTIGLIVSGAPTIAATFSGLAIGALGYGASITMWITGARQLGAARGQVVFALAPFIGAVLAWPIVGERLTRTTAIAFALSLCGVIVVATSRHRHRHVHDAVEHEHPIDADDVHHGSASIVVLAGSRHRHVAIEHEHEHLPDIHHRHSH
jgi:drug/metabolite transporter (DMT)-like permease